MKRLLVSILIIGLYIVVGCKTENKSDLKLKWQVADSILNKINQPDFPDRIFNITNYGAIPDGITNNTEAIKKTIDACFTEGGGIVFVPAGIFFTGPIHLKSNINLHLHDSAVLIFSVNPKDYLPLVLTSWEGMDCYNYSPLIYANKQENIAVTGKGLLNGQASGENWWPWKGQARHGYREGMNSQLDSNGRPKLYKFNEMEISIDDRKMGEDSYLRPSFIQFINCKNILLEDFTIINAPFWVIHPLYSENVIVRGLNINSHGPNNDGCDPEACKNVLIENCFFNSGDDCIALKSGRNEDGRRHGNPVKNIIIRNCEMQDGHGGVVIGSEISAGCKNIFVENCKMNSPNLDRAIRIKTNIRRGGIIEDIYIRNIEVGEVKDAVIRLNCFYENRTENTGNHPPTIQNIFVENVNSEKSKYGIRFRGLKEYECIRNINISNCNFNGVEKPYSIKYSEAPILMNVKVNGNELVIVE